MAFRITKELMAHGKVGKRLAWAERTEPLLRSRPRVLGLATSRGALVTEVVKGGPAEKAGIQNEDVILEYNGAAVADAGELRNTVAITKIGQEAKITVWRRDKKVS